MSHTFASRNVAGSEPKRTKTPRGGAKRSRDNEEEEHQYRFDYNTFGDDEESEEPDGGREGESNERSSLRPSKKRRLVPATTSSNDASRIDGASPLVVSNYPSVTVDGQVYQRNANGQWLCTRDSCPKAFESRQSVYRHVKDIHEGNNKSAICPICNKTFSDQRWVERHQKTAQRYPKCRAAWDAGEVLGSPGYVAPKMALGISPAPAQPSSASSLAGSPSGSHHGQIASPNNDGLHALEPSSSHGEHDPILPHAGDEFRRPLADPENQPLDDGYHHPSDPRQSPGSLQTARIGDGSDPAEQYQDEDAFAHFASVEPHFPPIPSYMLASEHPPGSQTSAPTPSFNWDLQTPMNHGFNPDGADEHDNSPFFHPQDEQFDSSTGRLHRTDPDGLFAYQRSEEPGFLVGFDHTEPSIQSLLLVLSPLK